MSVASAAGLETVHVSASTPKDKMETEGAKRRRKELTDYLLREGLASYRDGRLSANSKGSSSEQNHYPFDQTCPKECLSPAPVDDVFEDKITMESTETNKDLIEKATGDMEKDDTTEAALEQVAKIIFEPSSDQEDELQDEDVTVDFEFNSKEATTQFEKALLEHRNSIGSYDGDEFIIENSQSEPFTIPTAEEVHDEEASVDVTIPVVKEGQNEEVDVDVDVSTAVEEQEDADDEQYTLLERQEDALECNQTDPSDAYEASTTVSSQMNAAFLASESQHISFETSGEQGYTTPKEQISSPEANDSLNESNHNESSNITDQNIEITLCSSRLEDDTSAMPQPDVSPLTEDDADKSTLAILNEEQDRIDRPSLEERVPHLHYNPPKSIASSRTDDESESEAVPEDNMDSVEPRDINIKPGCPTAYDVETDDDLLYDEDSQIGDDEVDHDAIIEDCVRRKSDSVSIGDALDLQEDIDSLDAQSVGVAENQPEPEKKSHKHIRTRLARRRWFDCCSLL